MSGLDLSKKFKDFLLEIGESCDACADSLEPKKVIGKLREFNTKSASEIKALEKLIGECAGCDGYSRCVQDCIGIYYLI